MRPGSDTLKRCPGEITRRTSRLPQRHLFFWSRARQAGYNRDGSLGVLGSDLSMLRKGTNNNDDRWSKHGVGDRSEERRVGKECRRQKSRCPSTKRLEGAVDSNAE